MPTRSRRHGGALPLSVTRESPLKAPRSASRIARLSPGFSAIAPEAAFYIPYSQL